MINLVGTTQKLQVVLGAAKTTNDCPVYASFQARSGFNLGAAGTVSNLTPQLTNTNGVTAVDVVNVAANANTANCLEFLSVYNADTVPSTVTVNFNNNGTTYTLISTVLQVGQTLYYDSAYGWQISVTPRPAGKLVSLQAAGTLQNTYTTAKSILPAQAIATLAANTFQIGSNLVIEGVAGLSNIVTTPGLFNLQVKLGSVVAFDTGNIQLNATAHTLLPVWFRIALTCRSVGSGTTATLIGQAFLIGIHPTNTAGQTDGANTMTAIMAPAIAPAVGTGFDSTAALALDLWAGFTISNSGNGIQIQQYSVTMS